MKAKSQVTNIFPPFQALVENRFKTKILILYSDNGGEFMSLRPYLASKGIAHHTTPPHTPEHNGIAECKHRHIVETRLTLLQHACIPTTYWSYSFAAAVYLINRLTSPSLANSSPFQLLFQTSPNYSKLCTFGCLCYPWIRPYGNNKFSHRSTPCVFLGYSLTQSAFICLDVPTSRIYISRHMIFHESIFSFSSLSSQVSTSVEYSVSSPSCLASRVPVFSQPRVAPSAPVATVSPLVSASSPASTSASASAPTSENAPTVPVNTEPVPASELQLIPAPPSNIHPMTTRAKNNIQKPNRKYGLAAILAELEPVNLGQAMQDKRWRLAMSDEYNSMILNRTFDLVDRSLAKNIVGCRWVYCIKYLPNGSVNRFKARLVAKSFHQ